MSGFQRRLQPPKGSFFLLGPRGTGKSTWLRAAFPKAHRVDLLDQGLFHSYLADPGLFASELRALPAGSTVIVDEVQRLPSLLQEVHRFMEDRRMRFALCGSSARKLKREGTNLLAGRAVQRFMHPLLPEELGEDFDLATVLRWGSIPVIWNAHDRREALDAYAQMYLREEIQAEALVRNLSGFARFLPIAALFHAQVLNVSSVARDAGVARNTVLGYLDVLEDTLLTFQLPAYEARLRVRERKHPKLYWVDPGLPRALKKQLDVVTAEERGHLFEGWLASVLRAYRDYTGLFDEWWYWAPGKDSQVEVDFLLRKGKRIAAVEVKSTAKLHARDFAGLTAIAEVPAVARRIMVYLGDRKLQTEDGVEVLPLRAFLDLLQRGKLF